MQRSDGYGSFQGYSTTTNTSMPSSQGYTTTYAPTSAQGYSSGPGVRTEESYIAYPSPSSAGYATTIPVATATYVSGRPSRYGYLFSQPRTQTNIVYDTNPCCCTIL